jgi:hypothetical protein
MAAGYRIYRRLAPGPWFNSTSSPQEYERLYRAEVLAPLNPRQVAADSTNWPVEWFPAVFRSPAACDACYNPKKPVNRGDYHHVAGAWFLQTDSCHAEMAKRIDCL